MQRKNSAMNIRIEKRSGVPLRRQVAAQVEFQIASGELAPGDELPAIHVLARQLGIHHNTVSQAYQELAALNLLSGKRGARVRVRGPEAVPGTRRPDLDDLINQTIETARTHGFTLQQLSARVRERLSQQPPDHILVLSSDDGLRRLLKVEIEEAVRCRVEASTPQKLRDSPELALGALLVSAPGALPFLSGVYPKDRPPVRLQYSSAEPHFAVVRALPVPSMIAVATISEHFMEVARGLLSPVLGATHTLVECLLENESSARIPRADVLFCDAIVYRHVRRKRAAVYRLIAPECLERIQSALS